MNSAIMLLVGASIFLCIMQGIVLIYSRIHWLIKAGLISFILLFGWMFYTGLTDMLGFPIAANPPETFRYLSSVVREPTTTDPGAIFLWYIDPNAIQPRAVVLPYSKQLRDQMAEAKQRSSKSAVYMSKKSGSGNKSGDGESTGNESDSKLDPKGKGRSGVGNSNNPFLTGNGTYDFVPPPDTVPRKQSESQ